MQMAGYGTTDKLDEADAEASAMGQPQVPPRPAFGGPRP